VVGHRAVSKHGEEFCRFDLKSTNV
jgi:hypothetical protein